MRRFLLIFTALCSTTWALPFSSASCTLGSISQTDSLSCFIPFVVNGTSGFVDADAHVFEGFGTTVFITALADAEASLDPGVSWSAGGTSGDSYTFTTAGPVRPGFIAVSVSASGGISEASVTQDGETIGPNVDTTIPFKLGTPFQVSASAEAGVGAGAAGCAPCASSSSAGVQFQLFEADGQLGVIPFVVPVPEPAALKLFGFALAACALYGKQRSRRSLV